MVYVDRRRVNFGWGTHNAKNRCCIIEFYTWNVYNFISQCYCNIFNNLKKIVHGALLIKTKKYNHKEEYGGMIFGVFV